MGQVILIGYSYSLFYIHLKQHSTIISFAELILCRKCGADVADSSYIFTKHSPGAEKIKIQNLFGQKNITTQVLTNPYGITFDVVTIEKAKCDNVGRVSYIITCL